VLHGTCDDDGDGDGGDGDGCGDGRVNYVLYIWVRGQGSSTYQVKDNNRRQTTDNRLQTANIAYRQQIADSRQQETDSRKEAADSRQHVRVGGWLILSKGQRSLMDQH
jgi:hypothetical protein